MGNYTQPIPLQAIKVGLDTNLPKVRWDIYLGVVPSQLSKCGTNALCFYAHMSDTTCILAPFHWLSFSINVIICVLYSFYQLFNSSFPSLSSATTKV